MINGINFYGNFIDIVIDDSYRFNVSKECLKYRYYIKKLIGIHIFDQVTIDEILKDTLFDKSVCMELSIIFLKCGSIYEGIELFQYINSEYYLPYVVVDIGDNYVVCNDYCYIEPFLNYLDRCSWKVDINEINLISSKYNLSILENCEYIDINDFDTITDVLEKIDLCDFMIGGNDIVFDLAVSLGIKYVLIDKNSNINRFFNIVNILDEY